MRDRLVIAERHGLRADDLAGLVALAGDQQHVALFQIGHGPADRFAAVAELERGDVLLIAGKGHETGQIIGHKIVPFSDHEAVAKALATEANP